VNAVPLPVRAALLRLAYSGFKLQWRVLRPITLGVRLILVDQGQVLLVKHTYQPGWHFPGGALKRGEPPARAALREGYEEAGARVLEPPVLLGVYSSFDEGYSNHVLAYVSHDFRLEQPTDRWEIAERRLFPLDDLPPDLSTGSRRRLAELAAGPGPYAGTW
jgi:ADP-ribose pyrophosphatase YjhB (NUDIX family)